jgi:hypothetical protein
MLSFRGRYEPASIGLNGVKDFDWAPSGFVHDYRWRWPLVTFYLPPMDVRSRLLASRGVYVHGPVRNPFAQIYR